MGVATSAGASTASSTVIRWRVDHTLEQLRRRRPAMECLAVDLEEEPLGGPQPRVGDVSPPGPHGVLERDGRVRNELLDRVPLPTLDLLHDGHPQTVLGAEVV